MEGPGLKEFMAPEPSRPLPIPVQSSLPPYLDKSQLSGNGRKVYMEIYGCQMNVNDADIAWTFLSDAGYLRTQDVEGADVILAVIRDNAERKIWARLDYFRSLKKKRPRSKPPLRVGTVMYSILYVPLSI
jgi:hypothetical protein